MARCFIDCVIVVQIHDIGIFFLSGREGVREGGGDVQ